MKIQKQIVLWIFCAGVAGWIGAENLPESAPLSPEKPTFNPGKDVALDLGNGQTMEFVWIQTLQGWAGKYEVTNDEYRQFRPEHSSGDYRGYSLDEGRQPAVYVSWNDTQEFIAWLETRCGSPKKYEFTLPSKKEWLLVARCGTNRMFPSHFPPQFGNYADTAAKTAFDWKITLYGYTDGSAVACPVEQSGQNEWGLYGITGNVWEWTEEADGRAKMVRGASWATNNRFHFRCEGGGWFDSDTRQNRFGFRLFLLPENR